MRMVQELLRPAATGSDAPAERHRSLIPHPVIMMILIIAAAVLLSWVIPSGWFDRLPNGHVVGGTYQQIPKQFSLDALLLPHHGTPTAAWPAPVIGACSARCAHPARSTWGWAVALGHRRQRPSAGAGADDRAVRWRHVHRASLLARNWRLSVIARPLGRSNPVGDEPPAAHHQRDCFGQAASQ